MNKFNVDIKYTVFFVVSDVLIFGFVSVDCFDTVGSNIDSRFFLISSTSESSSPLVSLSVDVK